MDNKIGGTFIEVIEELVGVNVEEMNILEETDDGRVYFGEDIIKFTRAVQNQRPRKVYGDDIEINLSDVSFELYEAISKMILRDRYEDTSTSISVFPKQMGVTVSTGISLLTDSIYFKFRGDPLIGYLLEKGDRIIVGGSEHSVTKGKHEGKIATVLEGNDDSAEFLVEVECGDVFKMSSNEYYLTETQEEQEGSV